jgi:hypothetical protein
MQFALLTRAPRAHQSLPYRCVILHTHTRNVRGLSRPSGWLPSQSQMTHARLFRFGRLHH